MTNDLFLDQGEPLKLSTLDEMSGLLSPSRPVVSGFVGHLLPTPAVWREREKLKAAEAVSGLKPFARAKPKSYQNLISNPDFSQPLFP